VASGAVLGKPLAKECNPLVASDITSSAFMGTPAIGQVHALTALGISSTGQVEQVPLGQVHALAGTGIGSSTVLEKPVFALRFFVWADDLSSGAFVGNPAIGQGHALLSPGIGVSPAFGWPVFTQDHKFIATGIASSLVIGTAWFYYDGIVPARYSLELTVEREIVYVGRGDGAQTVEVEVEDGLEMGFSLSGEELEIVREGEIAFLTKAR
jgi:hypothetical protein